MLMEFLSPTIALIAGVVAIRGNTWDREKKGFKKVTLTGWLTVFLLIVAFAIGIMDVQDSIHMKSNILSHDSDLKGMNNSNQELREKIRNQDRELSNIRNHSETLEKGNSELKDQIKQLTTGVKLSKKKAMKIESFIKERESVIRKREKSIEKLNEITERLKAANRHVKELEELYHTGHYWDDDLDTESKDAKKELEDAEKSYNDLAKTLEQKIKLFEDELNKISLSISDIK